MVSNRGTTGRVGSASSPIPARRMSATAASTSEGRSTIEMIRLPIASGPCTRSAVASASNTGWGSPGSGTCAQRVSAVQRSASAACVKSGLASATASRRSCADRRTSSATR